MLILSFILSRGRGEEPVPHQGTHRVVQTAQVLPHPVEMSGTRQVLLGHRKLFVEEIDKPPQVSAAADGGVWVIKVHDVPCNLL